MIPLLKRVVGASLLLFFLSLWLAGFNFKAEVTKFIQSKEITVKSFNTLVFYHTILGIKFPRVATAQVRLETRNLTSNIYKLNNNMYGMKCDKSCWCECTKRGHAYYSHPLFSMLSYKCWQKKRLRDNPGVVTEQDYIKMLGDYKIPGLCEHCRYAEDDKYLDKIRSLILKFE